MPALRLLILSDGRPGHYHLADGIAAAARRLRTVEITKIEVSRGRWSGIAAATVVNAGFAARHALHMLSGRRETEFPPADLLVSAGAETLAANALIARLRQIPNIFYGSLRQFRPEDFALVLTSYERNASRPRHALALKPSAADPDLVRPADPWRPGKPLRVMGLLAGGNAGTFRYEPQDWTELLQLMERAHATAGIRWLVSNSRRTADAFSDAVASAAARSDGPIARFIDVRRSGAGTLGEIFAAADAVLVTDDSSSMLSEAIWMRMPVLGVSPRTSAHPPDEQHYRDWLARQCWCRALPIAGLTAERMQQQLATLTPLAANPLDDLAALLAARLPQLTASGRP